MEKNWIDAMIEREAIPKSARTETVAEFCAKWGVDDRTYYYQSAKSDNWKKVLEISLMSAKKEVPEVLKVLADKAKGGDAKFVDMYLNYVIQLAKQLDIKSDGKQVGGFNYIVPNDNNSADNQPFAQAASSMGETSGQDN